MTITQEIDLDPGEVYQEIHEPEHVALVLEGFIDTVKQEISGVTGVESLTAAQHYLEGALRGSGSVSYTSVTGNEGFLSSIKAGALKAWEYIKKMFQSIWNFFFGKANKEEEKKVSDQIAKAEDQLKAAESPKVTPANVEQVVKVTGNQIKKLPAGSDKTKAESALDSIIADLKGGKSQPKSGEAKDTKPTEAASKPTEAEVNKVIPEVVELVKTTFSFSVLNSKSIKSNTDRITKVLGDLETRKKQYQEQSTDTSYGEETRKAYKVAVADVDGLLKIFASFDHDTSKIKDVAAAKHFVAEGKRVIEAITVTLNKVKEDSASVKSKMAVLNEKVKGTKDEKEENKLTDDLFELSCQLNSASAIITFVNAIRGGIGNISYALGDQCPELKEEK